MMITRRFTKSAAVSNVESSISAFTHEFGAIVTELSSIASQVEKLPFDTDEGSPFMELARLFCNSRGKAMGRLAEGPYSDLLIALDALAKMPGVLPGSAASVQGMIREWANKGLDFWLPVGLSDLSDDAMPPPGRMYAWQRRREDVLYELKQWEGQARRSLDESRTYMPVDSIATLTGRSPSTVRKQLGRHLRHNPLACIPSPHEGKNEPKFLYNLAAAKSVINISTIPKSSN